MSEQELNDMAKFDIKVYQTQELKTFTALSQFLTEELSIKIDNQELSFRSMDRSHIALIDVSYPNPMFDKYEVSKEGLIAVRTKELNKLVKTFDTKESVCLSVSDDNLLTFKTKNSSQTLRLIESSNVDCPLPKLSYNAMVTISLKEFKSIIKRLKTTGSNHITLNMHDHILDVSAKGDNGSANLKLERGMESIPEFDLKEASESTYSIEYIEEFLKCLSAGLITLNFSTKMPIKIEAHESNYSKVHFYLAPRIES